MSKLRKFGHFYFPNAVKALAPRGHVIYAGTFSKMLMPGLRLGFHRWICFQPRWRLA